jgi:hypothetical protein
VAAKTLASPDMKLHKLSPGGVLTRLSAPERGDVEVSVLGAENWVDFCCGDDIFYMYFFNIFFAQLQL